MKRGLSKIFLIATAAVALASCGDIKRDAGATEQTEATVAEIEAAQMQGREAARRFVSREWKDSLQLHDQLLEVAARRSEYTVQKRYQERDAFDSTFISTVKTVRPGLVERIEKMRPKD